MSEKKSVDSYYDWTLGIFIALALFIQIVGSYWTNETVSTWYPQLLKPSWNPPAWLFAPVWSVLYIMIALSGALIYKAERSPERTRALRFYFAQLALNFIWSFLFFSLQNPFLAMLDIMGMLVLIALTIVAARPVSRTASYVLIPYFLWVMYAATLNVAIWWLNRT